MFKPALTAAALLAAGPALATGLEIEVAGESSGTITIDLLEDVAPQHVEQITALAEAGAYGGVVFHDVTNQKHARKAAEAGVDGIIAVAAGAGGHAGTINPFVLVHEIREVFDGTILLAGGLSHGEDLLAAQALGADLAYLGTRFINTFESQADEAYRNMIIEAVSGDIIHTPAVSGVPASFMRQSLEAAGFPMDELNQAGEINYGEKLKPIDDEAKAWKTVWSAGQGVSQIHDVLSVSELVSRLTEEYRNARERLLSTGS